MSDMYGRDRYRDRDDGSDDDYRSTTIRRYKVKPAREDRYENVEVDDDYRSRYSGRPPGDYDYYERRTAVERPRSAFEPHHDDRRSAFYERDVEREYSYGDPDKGRITVHEAKDSDHDDKRSRYSRHDDEIKVERRYEDRYEDSLGHDVDRYRKETEYYTRASPPPPPVIIRQRQEPQKIILQEAPPPAPVVVPRQEPGVVVLRDKDSHSHREHSRRDRDRGDEEYYYRHERREVGPYRGDRESERDHAMALARFDRHRRRDDSRSDDEDYWVHSRRVVRRERSESPHHKRHLAAGALAGAGITALMTSRANDHGEIQEHRGRKVIAGTALGALGTEAIRRAHSAYGERYRNRSESPGHHHKLKTGLGIAAVALAAAGAAKYYQANKVEKEEARRGRSRKRSVSRHSRGSASWSRSRSPNKSRSRRRRSLSTAAKAALGTAATAGLVKHFRDKSKARSGSRSKSRSKSRLRTAAEIGGAAAAAGVATKMWKNHKDKKERQSRERELSEDDRAFSRRGSPDDRSLSRHRSRSRSRSLARSSHLDSADPELGLVEYGRDPLEPEASARGYESEAEERRRRRRRRRERNASSDEGSGGERKRSKSRLRDMAAAGAAAFGIKEYKDRKDAEKRERRSRERRDREEDESRDGGRRDRSRDRSRDSRRDRSRDRSRRGDDDRGYFGSNPGRSSPPMASGGAYYPPYPATPNAGPSAGGYGAPYPNSSNPNPNDFQPYVPQDYMGYAPPPPGGVPPPAATGPGPAAGGYPAPPPGPTGPPHPPGGNYPPDHVSATPRGRGSTEDGVTRDGDGAPAHNHKSVSFGPMSPLSSRTMEQHHLSHAEHMAAELAAENAAAKATADDEHNARDYFLHDPSTRGSGVVHRRSSDPSSDRPPLRSHDGGRDLAVSNPQDDVEVLPDRFDAEGRPLDGRPATSDRAGGWTTRSGEFARRRQRPGDWGVRGSWQVGGTDPEAVERMAQGMTSALESRGGLLRFIGDVFTGGAGRLEDERPGRSDDGDRGRHRRR